MRDMEPVHEYMLDFGCYFMTTAMDKRLVFGSVGYEGNVCRWNLVDENTVIEDSDYQITAKSKKRPWD